MKRYLILENGQVFQGEAFGADGDVIAQIVFNTSSVGYVEMMTDKNYIGQAVVQTFPLLGNYGVVTGDNDIEGMGVSAYIVREWCPTPSNFRCEQDIDSYMKAKGVVGLCGIDTRALTRVLREQGTMNGMITDDPARAQAQAIRDYRIKRPVETVSVSEPTLVKSENSKYTVALLDFGTKDDIVNALVAHDCDVWVLPYNTAATAIAELKSSGLMLSDGPGDPTDNAEAIAQIKAVLASGLPTMGVGMGHQLLALANGFKTERLPYGHHGANQPVKCADNERVYITVQNHGYAVATESVDTAVAQPWFVNVNDHSNEGLRYKNKPALSVQFRPLACKGPQDTDFVYDEFIRMMEGC